MVMESKIMIKLKPYVGVILLQFGSAGFAIVAKAALNQGTSHYTFAVYRNAIAALLFAPFALFLERKTRPKMTFTIFLKIMLLGLLDPVFGQNLFYAGMNYTTATVTSAMCNLIPALTFLLAWILRLEIVNFKSIRSHAKVWGTAVAVGGAMIMTLIKGPELGLPWTHASHNDNSSTSSNNVEDPVKGALMIGAGCLGYSLFYILQANTLKTYSAGLSLTALICTFGSLQGTLLTFIVERDNISIWALGWDAKLLAYVYGVNFKKIPSHAKIWGTVITVGGAMIMTLIKGPELALPWTHASHNANSSTSSNNAQDPIKGALMVGAGTLGYSLFYILQANTLKTYSAGLSLTALICTFGSLQGTVLTFIVERGNTSIWALGWDAKLLAYVYGGIVSSGITYYVSGVIMKDKGPVFVTAFNPLSMVIVAVLSSFILAEQMDVGKLSGALVIVIGLYLVIWGKSKDQKEIELQPKLEASILPIKTSEIEKAVNDSESKTITGSNAV